MGNKENFDCLDEDWSIVWRFVVDMFSLGWSTSLGLSLLLLAVGVVGVLLLSSLLLLLSIDDEDDDDDVNGINESIPGGVISGCPTSVSNKTMDGCEGMDGRGFVMSWLSFCSCCDCDCDCDDDDNC